MQRIRVPELMDDPGLAPGLHHQALLGLERLNIISASADLLWSQLRLIPRDAKGSALRVLDIATGGGDIPLALAKRARKEGRALELVASDLSATALQHARDKATENRIAIEFRQIDALHDALPGEFDAVITSLFTHHLDPPQVVALLRNMASASRKVVIVNDLVRSRFAYLTVWLGTRILSRSPIVHFDGPVSVQASYTPQEMVSMAQEAGLKGAFVKQCPPCRQLLMWSRT
jgi:2-polyprenyl-3-methyl-5-hydroxy-6-metoxy-1,4-benzoquinol methylase